MEGGFCRRVMRVLGLPLLAAGSILFVLVGFEIGLRWLRPSESQAIVARMLESDDEVSLHLAKLKQYKYDEALGVFKCRPGDHRFDEFSFRCNSLGFRGPEWKKDGREAVLLLGDSQAFGWLLPDGKTIADSLKKKLNANVLNAGIGGYGQREELKILKHYGPLFSPGRVIIFFFENDLKDNARGESPFMVVRGYLVRKTRADGRPRDPERIGRLLDLWERGNKQPLVDYLRAEIREVGSRDSSGGTGNSSRTFFRWAAAEVRNSRILALGRESYDSARTLAKGLLKKWFRDRDQYWAIWSRYPTYQATIEALDELLYEIRRLSAKPLLVVIPSPTEMDKLSKGVTNTNSFFVEKYGIRRHVPTIILAKHFEPGSHCKYFGPKRRCDDKHLSDLGAEWTAELVARFLKAETAR